MFEAQYYWSPQCRRVCVPCAEQKPTWWYAWYVETRLRTEHVFRLYVEIKCQLDATEVFIADIIVCSTCFGHHYVHHQELKSIIQWLRPAVFRAVVFKLLVWCGVEGYVSDWLVYQHPANRTPDQQLESHITKYRRQQPLYNTLELLIMGIVVPETCWASNKICNTNLCCI